MKDGQNDPWPNWVAKRAAGSLRAVFDELCENIERDVQAMNETLPTPKFQAHDYRGEEYALDPNFVVAQKEWGDGVFVRFMLQPSPERILVSHAREDKMRPSEEPLFSVAMVWDDDSYSHYLVLIEDGGRIEPHQISQRALGPFFFED